MEVGMRFKRTDNMPYKDHGKPGIHHIVSIVEVTKVDWPQASWKTIEVLEESGKPSFAGDALETIGGFSIPMFYGHPHKYMEAL